MKILTMWKSLQKKYSPVSLFESGALAAWFKIRSSKNLSLSSRDGSGTSNTSPYSTWKRSCTFKQVNNKNPFIEDKMHHKCHFIYSLSQTSSSTVYKVHVVPQYRARGEERCMWRGGGRGRMKGCPARDWWMWPLKWSSQCPTSAECVEYTECWGRFSSPHRKPDVQYRLTVI